MPFGPGSLDARAALALEFDRVPDPAGRSLRRQRQVRLATRDHPRTWTEFRPNDSTADRPFPHISPVEIANATRFIKARHAGIADDELDVAVLQTFGRKRRTKQIGAHLGQAMEQV